MAIGLVLAALLPLGSPIWFPPALKHVAGRLGVEMDSQDRLGWSRLRLAGLRAEFGAVRWTARTLELPLPLAWFGGWLRGRALGDGPDVAPAIRMEGWSVEVGPSPAGADEGLKSRFGSVGALLDATGPAWDWLRWVGGPIRADDGRVVIAGRSQVVRSVHVDARRLLASVSDGERTLGLEVRREAGGVLGLEASVAPWGVALTGTMTPNADTWNLEASVGQGPSTNRLSLSSVFGGGAWLPIRARLRGSDIPIPFPAGRPGRGRIEVGADWAESAGVFSVRASGETGVPGRTGLSPARAEARGRVSTEQLDVTAFAVESGFLQASLHAPISWKWSEPTRLPPAELDLLADLEAFAGPAVSGTVRGHLSTPSGATGSRAVSLQFHAGTLRLPGLAPFGFTAKGELEWPRVRLSSLATQFTNAAALTVHGAADLSKREIQELVWQFTGPPPLTGLPANPGWPALDARGSLHGPFTNLTHAADFRTTGSFRAWGLRPLDIRGVWRGKARHLESLDLTVTRPGAELRLLADGSLRSVQPPDLALGLHALSLTADGAPRLALSGPSTGSLRWNVDAEGRRGPDVALENLDLTGPGGARLELGGAAAWPRRGRVHAALRAFPVSWITDWFDAVPEGMPDVQVRRLELDGSWDDGPVEGQVGIEAVVALPEVGPLDIGGSAILAGSGVEIRDVVVMAREAGPGEGAVTASARLPYALVPAEPSGIVRLVPDGTVGGRADVASGAWIWSWLERRTGLSPTDPVVGLEGSGTVEHPELTLAGKVGRTGIPLPGRAGEWVTLDALEFRARATRTGIALESLRLSVEGQPIQARARLPWGTDGGEVRWPPDWRQAEGELDLARTELGPLLRPWGKWLHPQGTARAQVRLEDGEVRGFLELDQLATRPIGPLGALRDIGMRLTLGGERITIERASAVLGAHPIEIAGWLTLPPGGQPEGELRVSGTNLALLRSPEAILRADLDLQLGRTNLQSVPRITGTVTLRDGLVMRDVRDLVAVNLDRPDQRPPYFSIDRAPFGDWECDLRIRGTEFARVLSPAFRGQVSADARLLGTLRTPRVLGQGVVDSGQIVFPFGQLKVEQARVRFSETDPHRPRLEGRATGMNFGYSIAMDISGTLDDPRVLLTSVPPMSTREIVQMLTAGSLPRGEYAFSTTGKAQRVGSYLAGDFISNLTGNPSEESRLSTRSGQQVTSNGRLTYGLEYRLTDRWSLVGEYDRWSQFNAGVRWRVLER